jgi:hypothetical protein
MSRQDTVGGTGSVDCYRGVEHLIGIGNHRAAQIHTRASAIAK